MKTIFRFFIFCLLALALFSCASGGKQPAYSADSVTLDTAMSEAARTVVLMGYFVEN